jgi:hypothetical protein
MPDPKPTIVVVPKQSKPLPDKFPASNLSQVVVQRGIGGGRVVQGEARGAPLREW